MRNFLTLAFMLGTFVLFANTNPNNNDKKDKKKSTKKEVKSTFQTSNFIRVRKLEMEDDGIHCRVVTKEKTVSCWFCNCAKLAESVR